MKTFAEELLRGKLVELLNENIGFARIVLSKAMLRQRINNKNFRFGMERFVERFFDCSNKCIAEKR